MAIDPQVLLCSNLVHKDVDPCCCKCRARCELAALKIGRDLLVNASRFKDLQAVVDAAKSIFESLPLP